MRKVSALLVTFVVLAGCGGGTGTKQAVPGARPASPSPTSSGSSVSSVSSARTVSTAAPTRPYVLKNHLYVGGQVVPGRFGVVTARGGAWVATSTDETTFWSTGTDARRLPDRGRGWLSPEGRYLLTVSRREDCDEEGKVTCVLRLLDTTGTQPARRLVLSRPVEVFGVSEQGLVMLTGSTDFRWEGLLWDAAGGARTVQPLEESPAMKTWAMQWWDPSGFGPAGFAFSAGNVPGNWIGEIVDGELRPLRRLPGGNEIEPGPEGRWVVGTAWPDTDAYPATKQIIRAWRVQGHRKPVLLRAPSGWSFAETATSVLWETADSFLVMVVDSRKGGDRLARCDIPLATCVTVAG